jgi:hypothetical protein
MKLFVESQRARKKLGMLVAALLVLGGPGCASLTLLNFKTEKIPTADLEHPAIDVLAVWQAAEGPGPKGIPTRGFAGQIFFFSQDRATPVAVDGTARIYVFDDQGTPQEQARPLHQFDFDRESWKGHLQMPKIGPTYGVFIPYTRNDYHQAVCSLRVRFTPVKGRPLYSASSTIVLPGPPAMKSDAQATQPSPLNSLSAKLQAQPKLPWGNPTIDTTPRPFNTGAQVATPVPGQFSQSPQTNRGALADAQLVNASGAESPVHRWGTPTSPLVQTAGTMPLSGAGAMNSVENADGYSQAPAQGALPPSGRFKLEAAAPVQTGVDQSSRGELPGGDDDERPTSHANHPLAD